MSSISRRTGPRTWAALALVLTCSAGIAAPPPRPTGPPTLRLSPAAIEALRAQVPEATLAFHQSGEIRRQIDSVYVDPAGRAHGVAFESNLGRDAKIARVRWQVARAPFHGDVDHPVGLLLSGDSDQRVFEVDFAEVARKAGLANAPKAGAARMSPAAAVAGRSGLERRVAVPGTPPDAPSAGTPALSRGAVSGALASLRLLNPPRFYVRAIPVNASGAVSGRPSPGLPVIWAAAPVPATDMSSFEVVSSVPFDLRVAAFRYVPSVTTENWPAGCEPIPRDEGKDALDVIGEAPGAVVDLVNWASEAYSDLKKMVVSVMASLLPFVPESVVSLALDSALAAAGLPPSIPNVDALMEGGADYLAVQMAAQIPTPASGPLAEMAADEARRQIRDRTKEALLEAAQDIARQRAAATRWCTRHVSEPYFEVTVRNAGSAAAEQVGLHVSDSAGLFEKVTLPIERIEAGEQLVLPVAYRQAKDIPVRYVSQIPRIDRANARSAWWDRYQSTPLSFQFALPQRRDCYGDGRCQASMRIAYTTPTRLWDNGPPFMMLQQSQ
ncbi:hypothetical protein [Marilutibacter maris]|uniref:hypothetical protein n=1 Tax=Marilutibacter maris TaxID=1605891 RepID=UPI000DAAD3FA|nr:hypothetical protein [Lysobacter maris]